MQTHQTTLRNLRGNHMLINLQSGRLIAIQAAILLSALVATTATANEDGWFIGGSFQYVQIDGRIDSDLGEGGCCGLKVDDNGTGFSLGGGYRFNPYIAVDAAYWDLGDVITEGIPGGGRGRIGFDFSAWTIGGIASLPISIFELYGRAGLANWEADGRQIDGDDTDGYFGVGWGLNIGESVNLYVEYLYIDAEAPVDTIGAGLRYKF